MLPHVKSSVKFLKVSQFSEKYKLTLRTWKVKFLVFEAARTIVRKWFDPNQLQSILFWSTDFGELYIAPDLTVVKLWSLVFTWSHVEDVAGKDHISWYTWETSRSSWLWRLANGSCPIVTFIVIVERFFACVPSYLRYRLPFDAYLPSQKSSLQGGLSISPCFSKEVYSLQCSSPYYRCCFAESLLHIRNICFGVFDYGEVKRTFVSELLKTSTKILFQ